MSYNRLFIFLILFPLCFHACKEHKNISEKQVVEQPAQINASATEIIQASLTDLLHDSKHIQELPLLKNAGILDSVYNKYGYLPIWTNNGQWTSMSDSLFTLLDSVRNYGLFPSDYFVPKLSSFRTALSDTMGKDNKLDAALWAKTDLYLTAAFVQITRHLMNGRILQDSTDLRKDSALDGEFFTGQLESFKTKPIEEFAAALEPKHRGYHELKTALTTFLPRADLHPYTYIDPKDSVNLYSNIRLRLIEDSIETDDEDSVSIAAGIKRFQKLKKLKVDGKINAALVKSLNENDWNKFVRIAINLDRYKMLPDTLPAQYIWVNIPGYYMKVVEEDTVRLSSKVVVGKPETRTPILSSTITDMITYPQWTIPESIIKKDILPGLKKDPAYTRKKGFSLIDGDGNEVDPTFVDWHKYEKGIPYKVVQGSGDDNALGVMKFNFSNKYSVYLHDTNQRYLFSKKTRALSHGCVRVQSWDSLAYYILQNDSLKAKNATPVDSLNTWLASKQKRVIPVRKRIPLFIRYFTAEAKEEKLVFYDDVYGDDRRLKEKFFANKN